MTLNTFLGQPCCICIKEDNFGLKGSETDVTGIHAYLSCMGTIHVFLPVFALSTKLFKGFVHVHAYLSCMGTTSCFSANICSFDKIIQRICTCTCLFKLYGYNFMFVCQYLLFRQNYSTDLYMYMLILVIWVQLHVFLPLFALSTKLFKGFVHVHAYLSCMGTTSCFSASICSFDKIIQRICTCTCLF